MEKRRALIVVSLCVFAELGVTFATTLEELFIAQTGWMPGITAGTIQAQHNSWHATDYGVGFKGREFLEYHRELLAQSDDFRIYGSDDDLNSDPDPAVIPVIPESCFGFLGNQPDCLLKFEHVGSTCTRPEGHAIDDGAHDCHLAASWTPRPTYLQMILDPVGNDLYDYASIDALGVEITRDFHNQGHGAIGRHQPFDMIPVLSSVKDGGFYQWHKNIDNIYADWAVARYQKSDKSGLPMFFSVRSSVASPAVGIADSALFDRTGSAAYEGRPPATRVAATQYGASPRIASDIYVGDHAAAGEYKNLLFAAGTRKWGTATDAWDVDAWSVLNATRGTSGWYFSVTKDSTGEAGSGVIAEPAGQKGGAIFESLTSGGGSNQRIRTAADLGLAATDELDALDVDQQRQVQGTNDTNAAAVFNRPKQWFSLRAGSETDLKAIPAAGGLPVAVTPSDILRFDLNGNLVQEVAGSVLGLVAGDDLDALAITDENANNVFDGPDRIYFSLVKLSPSLGADSAADILCKTKAGANCSGGTRLAAAAATIGLDPVTDDLDALDYRRGQNGLSGFTATGLVPATGATDVSVLLDPLDPGACCHANGTCTEVLSTACVNPGDSFSGFDTVCSATQCPSAPGACCASTGTCTVVSDRDCFEVSGTFRGPGTTCPPSPACSVAPSNDECVNAIAIPYNFSSPFEPPSSDNTNATIPNHHRPPFQDDPPYSCNDHKVFSGPYGSGTIWYSYTVPSGTGPRRSIYLTMDRAAALYPNGGAAGDTRIALYYAPNGNCSVLQEVACADNVECNDPLEDTERANFYEPLRYDNPLPGRYYIQLSTTFNVDRGKTFLTVSDPPTYGRGIPTVSNWGLAVLSLLLVVAGALLLRLRTRVAT